MVYCGPLDNNKYLCFISDLLTMEEVVASLRFATSASSLPSVALHVEEYELGLSP